jgi:hypothetical protein
MWPGYLKLVLQLLCLGTRQDGQDLVEYAMVVALLGLAVTASNHEMAIVLTTGLTNINSYFQTFI